MSTSPDSSLIRRLIVNADDFGRSHGINRGILRAHDRGIVTSASLMVRWAAAAEAAAGARDRPGLSLGLHVDLCEWTYCDRGWEPRYEVVAWSDAGAVAAEVSRQLEAFRQLTGRLPTHLDSHQHVHRQDPLRSILIGLAARLNVPLREFCADVTYCGSFFGQTARAEPLPEAIGVEGLISTLRALPGGTSELACHPAAVLDWDSPYGAPRLQEMRTLCDRRVRAALEREAIELCSFDLPAIHRSGGVPIGT